MTLIHDLVFLRAWMVKLFSRGVLVQSYVSTFPLAWCFGGSFWICCSVLSFSIFYLMLAAGVLG